MAAIPAFLATIVNPAAPIVLPVIAGVVIAVWLHDVYQNVYVNTSLKSTNMLNDSAY